MLYIFFQAKICIKCSINRVFAIKKANFFLFFKKALDKIYFMIYNIIIS